MRPEPPTIHAPITSRTSIAGVPLLGAAVFLGAAGPPIPAAWLGEVPSALMVALGLGLAALAAISVVTSWVEGSWWAVPATAGLGFGGAPILTSMMLYSSARDRPDSVGQGGLAFVAIFLMLAICAAVATVVALFVAVLRKRKGPTDPAISVLLAGGAVAGLVLLAWGVVLWDWANHFDLNRPAEVPAPTGRLLVLLATGLVGGLVWAVVGRGIAWLLDERPAGFIAVAGYLGAAGALWLAASLAAWDDPDRFGSCVDTSAGCPTPTATPRPTARPTPTPKPTATPVTFIGTPLPGEAVTAGPLTVRLRGVA